MKIDLDDNFHNLMRRVWPKVSETSSQYSESRKVWFATIHWVLCTILEVAELPEEEAEKVLEDWQDQVKEFHKEIDITYKEDV